MCNNATSFISRLSTYVLAITLFVLTAATAFAVKPTAKKGDAKSAAEAFAVSAELPADAQVGREFSFDVAVPDGANCDIGEEAPKGVGVSDCNFTYTPNEVGNVSIPVKVTAGTGDEAKTVAKTFTVVVHQWAPQSEDFAAIQKGLAALQGANSNTTLTKLLEAVYGTARPNTIDLTRDQLLLANKKIKYMCYAFMALALCLILGGIARVRRTKSIWAFFGAIALCAILFAPTPSYAAGLEVKSISPTAVKVGETVIIKACGTGLSDKDDVDFSDKTVLEAVADDFVGNCHSVSAKGLKVGEVKLVVTPDGGKAITAEPAIQVTATTAPAPRPAAPQMDYGREAFVRLDMRSKAAFNVLCGTKLGEGRCGKDSVKGGLTGPQLYAMLLAARTQEQEDVVFSIFYKALQSSLVNPEQSRQPAAPAKVTAADIEAFLKTPQGQALIAKAVNESPLGQRVDELREQVGVHNQRLAQVEQTQGEFARLLADLGSTNVRGKGIRTRYAPLNPSVANRATTAERAIKARPQYDQYGQPIVRK